MYKGRFGLVAVVCACLLAGGVAWAQTASESATETSTALLLVESQIAQKLFLSPAGREQMQSASSKLTEEQRSYLFSSRKKDDALLAAVLNVAAPGLGSAIQSDWGGGIFVFAGWLVGGVSFGLALGSAENEAMGLSAPIPTALQPYVAAGGIALLLTAVVTAVVRPSVWVSTWNKDLAEGLGTKVTFLDIEGPQVAFQSDPLVRIGRVDLDLVSFHP